MATLRRPQGDDGLDEKLLAEEPGVDDLGTATAAAAKKKAVSYYEVFRYMDDQDRILLVTSLVAAAINGAAFPSFTFIFSGMLNALYSRDVVEKVRGRAFSARFPL